MKKLFTILSSLTLISIFSACGNDNVKTKDELKQPKVDLSILNTDPIEYDLSEYILPSETYFHDIDSEQKILEKTVIKFRDQNITSDIFNQLSTDFIFNKDEFDKKSNSFIVSNEYHYKYSKGGENSVREYEGDIVDDVIVYPNQFNSETFINDDNITLISYNEDNSTSSIDTFHRFYTPKDIFFQETDDENITTSCTFIGHIMNMNSKDNIPNMDIPSLDYSDVLKIECSLSDDKNSTAGTEFFYYAKGIGLVLSLFDSDIVENNVSFNLKSYTLFTR